MPRIGNLVDLAICQTATTPHRSSAAHPDHQGLYLAQWDHLRQGSFHSENRFTAKSVQIIYWPPDRHEFSCTWHLDRYCQWDSACRSDNCKIPRPEVHSVGLAEPKSYVGILRHASCFLLEIIHCRYQPLILIIVCKRSWLIWPVRRSPPKWQTKNIRAFGADYPVFSGALGVSRWLASRKRPIWWAVYVFLNTSLIFL